MRRLCANGELKKVNGTAAEQVFAWFRGYARTLNEMRPVRHKFVVLYYSTCHNNMIDDGDTSHLNQYSAKTKALKKKVVGYACRPSKAMMKSKKTMRKAMVKSKKIMRKATMKSKKTMRKAMVKSKKVMRKATMKSKQTMRKA